jgi:hypothetical protein
MTVETTTMRQETCPIPLWGHWQTQDDEVRKREMA